MTRALFSFCLCTYLYALYVLLRLTGWLLWPGSGGGGELHWAAPLAFVLLLNLPRLVRDFWRRLRPDALRRGLQVLSAAALLHGLVAYWSAWPLPLWSLQSEALRALCFAAQSLSLLLAVLACVLGGHLELFGLSPAWRRLRGQPQIYGLLRQELDRRRRRRLLSYALPGLWCSAEGELGRLSFTLACTLVWYLRRPGVQQHSPVRSLPRRMFRRSPRQRRRA